MKGNARGDFSADRRLLQLSTISIAIGAIGAVVAVVLLKLIAGSPISSSIYTSR
jgi:hypothetical protein